MIVRVVVYISEARLNGQVVSLAETRVFWNLETIASN